MAREAGEAAERKPSNASRDMKKGAKQSVYLRPRERAIWQKIVRLFLFSMSRDHRHRYYIRYSVRVLPAVASIACMACWRKQSLQDQHARHDKNGGSSVVRGVDRRTKFSVFFQRGGGKKKRTRWILCVSRNLLFLYTAYTG